MGLNSKELRMLTTFQQTTLTSQKRENSMSVYIRKVAATMNLKRQDAKRPLDIHVTALDCKRAKKKDAHNCAFAIACKRQDKRVRAAYFFKSVAWLQYAGHVVRYLLPPSMQKEIVAFDRGGAAMFAPGDYHLSPPCKTQRLGADKKGSAGRRRERGRGRVRGAKKLVRRHSTAMMRGLQE